MKKCTQCGEKLPDEFKFCFKCGGNQFETVDADDQTATQPEPQPEIQQPIYQQNLRAQNAYQRNAYEQYQGQQSTSPVQDYKNTEPATIGNYLLFEVFMIIPIFNLVYLIMVAVGGPKYKKSMTNYARARLILMLIAIPIIIILCVSLAAFANDIIDYLYYPYY